MIDVIVPTFDRPLELKRAIRSLYAQSVGSNGFRIIIVDNTPDANAASAVADLKRSCPSHIELCVLHEPSPGVANARNKAIQHLQYDLIAFLDDDQTAPKDWLSKLIKTHSEYPAAVLFGPVLACLPNDTVENAAYFRRFFSRDPDLSTGFITESFGSGNALIDVTKVPGSLPWFNIKMNETGGEDDLLFERIRLAGERFGWAANAPVWEHPPESRVRLSYTLKRAFSFGQGPITIARQPGRCRPDKIAIWMVIGLVKSILHFLGWGALCMIRHPMRAGQLDLAVRGIAKVFWWIEFRFYGQSTLEANH